MDADVTVKDNSKIFIGKAKDAKAAALVALGMKAEGYAVLLCPHDTGRLRNSITFVTRYAQGEANTQSGAEAQPEDYKPRATPDADSVYIGTNVEYAAYVEFGTSRMAPRSYLKRAVADHADEYKRIVEKVFKDASDNPF